MNIFEHCLKIW